MSGSGFFLSMVSLALSSLSLGIGIGQKMATKPEKAPVECNINWVGRIDKPGWYQIFSVFEEKNGYWASKIKSKNLIGYLDCKEDGKALLALTPIETGLASKTTHKKHMDKQK